MVAWSGSDIFLPKEECGKKNCVEISQQLRASACVSDHKEAIRVIKVLDGYKSKNLHDDSEKCFARELCPLWCFGL